MENESYGLFLAGNRTKANATVNGDITTRGFIPINIRERSTGSRTEKRREANPNKHFL